MISIERDQFIAAIRHIGWVYYQIAAGQPYNEKANDDQLRSLLDGIKYADEHPGMTPEQNHENWMKMKTSQGWKYGPVKDFDLKTHPDLVPFDELPDIEKRKDIADHVGHRLASELWDKLNPVDYCTKCDREIPHAEDLFMDDQKILCHDCGGKAGP